MDANALWSMPLLSSMGSPCGRWWITRVPGGWLFEVSGTSVTAVFVPLHNEFSVRRDEEC